MRIAVRSVRMMMCGVVAGCSLAVGTPWVHAGATFVNSASSSKLFFDPDLSGGTQSKTIFVNPPSTSAGMPAPSAYQLSQTFTNGSASSVAKGSVGYVLNSTTATWTLAAGSGVTQSDPSNLYPGASQLRIDFDGRFHPTSPSFGPFALGYVSIAVGGVVGTGGYAYFAGQVDFLNASTNAPLRSQVNFGATTFSTVGTFAKTYTSSAVLGSGSVAVGTPIRVKGFFEFRASNADEPSEILPIYVDAGGAPPTAVWHEDADGVWTDAARWTPPAGSFIDDPGNTLPSVPNGIGHRALIANIFNDNHIITLGSNITLGALDFDTRRAVTLATSSTEQLVLDTQAGNATVHVRNVQGAPVQAVNAGVALNDSIEITVDGSYFGPDHPKPRSSIAFNGVLAEQAPGKALIKLGEGTAALNLANPYSGGTVIGGGKLDANVTASLGSGNVHADDGQLNYNAPHAAAPGIAVLANNNGQVDLGIVPDGNERFVVEDLGAVSGSAAELAALTNGPGSNLQISPGGMIGHETFDVDPLVGNPAGIAGPPQYIFGIAADVPSSGSVQEITVGTGSAGPWRGFGGDRSDRVFGSSPTTTQDQVLVLGQADLVSLHETLIINAQVLSEAGTASLTKRGRGTVILNNVANVFDGPIVVQASSGTLLVDGVLQAQPNLSVTVHADSTIGGTGTIAAPVTALNDSAVSPGSNVLGLDVSTLTVGALSLSDTTRLIYDLDDPAVAGAGINDLIEVNGDLLLDGILDISDAGDFGPGTYTLMEFTGAISNQSVQFGYVPDIYDYAISIVLNPGVESGGSVLLNVTIVPEPSGPVVALMLLLVALALARRTRTATCPITVSCRATPAASWQA